MPRKTSPNMSPGMFFPMAFASLLLLALPACDRQAPAPSTPAPTPGAPAPATTVASPLQDVVETTPSYIIGITYPKSAAKYPELASALQAYSAAARKDLMQAVEGLGNDKPTAPYDL